MSDIRLPALPDDNPMLRHDCRCPPTPHHIHAMSSAADHGQCRRRRCDSRGAPRQMAAGDLADDQLPVPQPGCSSATFVSFYARGWKTGNTSIHRRGRGLRRANRLQAEVVKFTEATLVYVAHRC